MSDLFKTYISCPSVQCKSIYQEIIQAAITIGLGSSHPTATTANTSEQWQASFDHLQQADLFIGVYSDVVLYTGGGILYHDGRGGNYAISRPLPQQALELGWAIKLQLPMLLWIVPHSGPHRDPTWEVLLEQVRGQRYTRILSPEQPLTEQVRAAILQQWVILMLKACWRNWFHPDLPPRPLLS